LGRPYGKFPNLVGCALRTLYLVGQSPLQAKILGKEVKGFFVNCPCPLPKTTPPIPDE
jgi:hypothetical protein